MARIERRTRETTIVASVKKGKGVGKADVPEDFLKHMVETLARYSGYDIAVTASGDLRHHTIEDVAISLGRAFREEVDADNIERMAAATIPMDDALVTVAIDFVDRPFFVGELPEDIYTHFFRSFAFEARVTLHVDVRRGTDKHHVIEAAFKGLGKCIAAATAKRPGGVSTKGKVAVKARK
ncbi:MAG: imidazoleglycerol-phosphate dehydratase [Euryarchaeota archaeon]|nr:imidazoleglycerol-phosphate dehydratase [Euryarchaeota archaeon]